MYVSALSSKLLGKLQTVEDKEKDHLLPDGGKDAAEDVIDGVTTVRMD
jgi:hypothetical protein